MKWLLESCNRNFELQRISNLCPTNLNILNCYLFSVLWLDHSKTLREQNIDGNETLLLRRKFFFSDQNVDARDPVQLNLLYVQVSVPMRLFSAFFAETNHPLSVLALFSMFLFISFVSFFSALIFSPNSITFHYMPHSCFPVILSFCLFFLLSNIFSSCSRLSKCFMNVRCLFIYKCTQSCLSLNAFINNVKTSVHLDVCVHSQSRNQDVRGQTNFHTENSLNSRGGLFRRHSGSARF